MLDLTLKNPILLLAIAALLAAAWAMAMMVIAAVKHNGGRYDPWSLLNSSFARASYNRRYFRIFAICVAVGVGLAILFNVLFLIGHIK
jgi:hypothetical protein